MSDKPTQTGPEVIENFVRTLPGSPGVYRMLDASGNALYVGKARNLKKRVQAYTQLDKHVIRIQRMIVQTAHMEFVTTHTEAEALLLEANLIRKLKPRYNVLLRDDKSFPYILITGDHEYPLVTKHRGAKDRKGEYFGPFASGAAVNETLATLHRAFMLRNCPDTVFAARTRPCLQHQIKRCTAPCVGRVTKEQYAQQVDMARQFLKGSDRGIQEAFVQAMQVASDRLDYETAAQYRDRIRALTTIQSQQSVNVDKLKDADIFALHQKDGQSCVQVFFFRGGQNFGNRPYFPRHDKDEAPDTILASFIMQFYASRPTPKEILTNIPLPEHGLLSEALKADVACPVRGTKKDITAMAEKNAREALERKRATDATHAEILDRIAELFALETTPERIEVYDNSHTGGTLALGAMIVVGPEGFMKSSYRKFNMDREDIIPGDDFAMMREMLTRRFRPLGKNEPGAVTPDLVLIDGGQGQLNVARQAMADLGVADIPVVGIAKGPDRNAGRERFFMPDREPFSLAPNDPILYFLQRVRDEAHRFAITSHRARRAKAITQSPLDEVPGIGARRKKALLLHFGSAKAVAEAGLADLQKVEGISKATAEAVYNFFHDGE